MHEIGPSLPPACQPCERGVVLQLADGTVQACNPTAQKILGLTLEQLQGWNSIDPPWQAIHADGSPFSGQTHPAMVTLRTGQPCTPVIMGLYRPSGDLVWLLINTEPLFNVDDTAPYAVLATFVEVAEPEQHGVEPAVQLTPINPILVQQEALYRALTQHIPNGAIHVFDHDLRYLLMEGNELKKLGLEGAALVGKTIWEVLPLETCVQIEPMYRAALAGQVSVEEVSYQDQIYEVHTVPVTHKQGEVFAGMVLTQNITRRKQVEAQLKADQALLQRQLAEIEMIYQSAPIGLNVLDADLRFVRINQRLADMNGLPIEAHIGHTVRELLPEIADEAEQILGSVLATGEPRLNVEITGETPAQPGVQRVWLESFLPLKDGDRVLGISTVCEEITEQKQTEAALRQFQLLIELSYEPILVWSLEQGIISWNQGCENLYGYTREEAVGQTSHTLLQTLHPPSQTEFVASLERDRQWTGELKHLTRSGKQVTVESRQQIIEMNGQKLVLETNRDITERKQVEAALREHTQHTQLLYETTRDLLSTTQPLALIETVFNKLKDLIGLDFCFNYLLDQQQQLHLAFYAGISPEIAKEVERIEIGQAFCGAVAQQQRQIVQADVQRCSDPKVQLLQPLGITAYACQPLIAQGKLLGTLGFGSCSRIQFTPSEIYLFQAICDHIAIAMERSHLLSSLQQQTEELTQANRIKDEFLAILSHELRTPLNPILGWSKLLQAPQVSPERLQQGLATIERNAKQQVQLVDDLLDTSRIIRGDLALNLRTLDLSVPIKAALETVRLAAEAKAIQIEVLLDSRAKFTKGDVGRLQQVFWNLLSNAIKFTPQNGQITVQLTQVDHQAHIQISDTGKGIKADFLPYAFELFRQQDSSITRAFGGLGLGLAIARQVVEAHRGTITVASAGEDQGTTFTVQLPLMSTPQPNPPKDLNDPTPTIQNLRILLVDDEVDSLEVVKVLLEQEGAKVTTVSSGSKALRMLIESQFDLLIGDIGMPDMDGYTFIRNVRSLPPRHNRQIPAIALTAYAGETSQKQALAAGFQTHLAKPIDPQKLITAIATIMTPYPAGILSV